MTTTQHKHHGPVFFVLAVLGAILAIPVALFLLIVAHFVLQPRPEPLSPEAVSPVVATPDGTFTAQVWRHEGHGGGSWGDAPIRFRWLLSVTGPTGTHDCGVGGGAGNEYDVDANRKVRLSVSWAVPGRILSVDSGQGSTTVYVLDTCVMPMRSPTLVTAAPLELTETLRSKLERLHLPAAEIDRLGYVQLQGTFFGTQSMDFFCERDDVLLVIGPGFKTPGHIVSKGPVLLIGEASCSEVGSNKWVFVDDHARVSWRLAGSRVYAVDSLLMRRSQRQTNMTLVPSDDPGEAQSTTRPMNAAQVRRFFEEGWPAHPVRPEPAPTAATLTNRVIRPIAVTAQPAELTPELSDRLKPLNLPEDQVSSLRYVRLTDHSFGTGAKDFVCDNENTLIVLEAGFQSHSSVFSHGPVLCAKGARVSDVRSLKWVFIDAEACPTYVNAPVIYVNRGVRWAGVLGREPVLVPPDPQLDDYLQLRSRPGEPLGTRSSPPR